MKMKQSEALLWARKIARIIRSGADRVGKTRIKDQGLMATLSIMLAARSQNSEALNPAIEEIVLFGSAARPDNPGAWVDDIDLMMFDNGFYSNILSVEPMGRRMEKDSGSLFLQENLTMLLKGWFQFSESDQEVREILEIPLVDLHVLPIAIFTDKDRQRAITSKHHDPQFFENAFSAMRRFDPATEQFVPVDLDYFQHRRPADNPLWTH